MHSMLFVILTYWGRVTHICVGNLTIIGSDNGLSSGRCQAIIWTNAGILLIGPLGTNFSEILTKIITFSFKKMCLKVSSAKWCPFCLGLNVLVGVFDGHGVPKRTYKATVWETKFLEHLPENRCSLYILYKIPLAKANFLLALLKMHSHWWTGECWFPSLQPYFWTRAA